MKRVLRFGACEIPVVEVEEKGLLGSWGDGEIRKCPGISPRMGLMVELHEMFHVISDALRLDLTEEQVEGLEFGVGCFLTQNPAWVREFMDGEYEAPAAGDG